MSGKVFTLLLAALACGFIPNVVLADTKITPDVVYGHKAGLAMTYDVFQPDDPNGKGVLFMVSGGWFSRWMPPERAKLFFAPVLQEGFTVFAVRHGSSPRFTVKEAVADVRQAVRFIRLHADDFDIDPDRLGVYGMSAGGHLSLMLGTASDDGIPDHKDPVQRVSSRVQCVAAYVAPTDLQVVALGGTERLPAHERFPGLKITVEQAKGISPIEFVTPDDPPTLLLAGVKDELVPIVHSRRIHDAFEREGVVSELVEYPNSAHGFVPADTADAFEKLTAWFRIHLLDEAEKEEQSSDGG